MSSILRNPLLLIVILLLMGSLYIYKRGKGWWVKGKITEIEWFINRQISEQIQTPITLVETIDAFPNLKFEEPMSIRFANDGSNKVFVAERCGRIMWFTNETMVRDTHVLMNITSTINYKFQKGLLDFIFHSDLNSNPFIYILYNIVEGQTQYIRLSKLLVDPTFSIVAQKSEIELFKVKAKDHQGGSLAIGNDGCLYISIGDGLDTDPEINAQNLKLLNGKLLRIDMNGEGDSPYAIPKDNPFYKNSHGYRPEIFAYGFRNPFRFSIDSLTNSIFLGDVGQSDFEEINLVTKGGNYGWPIMEANSCFRSVKGFHSSEMIAPLFYYPHGIEGFSITGGLVYRGNAIPELYGSYLYADYVRGAIWGWGDTPDKPKKNQLIATGAGNITCFREDAQKEVHYCDFSSGKIKKLVRNII